MSYSKVNIATKRQDIGVVCDWRADVKWKWSDWVDGGLSEQNKGVFNYSWLKGTLTNIIKPLDLPQQRQKQFEIGLAI